jgi:DNA-binding transcriptional LysR family regulator
MFFLSKNMRYFIAVAQYASITKAADYLCITPSPLSKYISQLESRLGYPLFFRYGNGMKLTPKGERVYEELFPHFVKIADLERKLSTNYKSRLKTLTVGTSGFYAGFLSCFYQQLDAKASHSLSIFLLDESEMFESLTCNNIDLSLSSSPLSSSQDIIQHTLAGEPIKIAVSPTLLSQYNNDILKVMKHVPWAQSTNIKFMSSHVYNEFNNYIHKMKLQPNIIRFHELYQRLKLVEQGKSISIVPASIMHELLDKNIQLVETPEETLYLIRYLAYHRNQAYRVSDLIPLLLESYENWIKPVLTNNKEGILLPTMCRDSNR